MTRPYVLLLNGPNLNLLGKREPTVYGSATLEEHVAVAEQTADSLGYDLVHVQSNGEQVLVEAVHQHRETASGIVINPGAFTHYGWALADALAMFPRPVVELHISNPQAREAWRHTSVVSPIAKGTVVGFGGTGYRLAIEGLISTF